MNQKIICTTGQASSGKDTVCDYIYFLLNKYNKYYYWSRTSFAKKVKEIFMEAFGVDENFIEKWKRSKEIPPGFIITVRQALQLIGDGFRKINPNIWIDKCLESDDHLIISDGRYFNEAKVCHQRNSFNILIWRPGYENDDQNLSEAEIRPLIDWCAKNLSNGMITHDQTMPMELGYYDYFLINDKKTVSEFYKDIEENLFKELLNYF